MTISRARTMEATSLATSGRLGSSRTKLIIPVLGTPRARTETPVPSANPKAADWRSRIGPVAFTRESAKAEIAP